MSSLADIFSGQLDSGDVTTRRLFFAGIGAALIAIVLGVLMVSSRQ